MKNINPLALRILPDQYNFIYLKISPGVRTNVTKVFEERWLQIEEKRAFSGGFLKDEMNLFYQFFYDMGSILTFIATIALTITCLGFLGMVSFDLKKRAKEMGIRKVLGAKFQQLTISMTKGFVVMLTTAGMVTVPIAILGNRFWINEMASHSPMDIWSVLPAILIVMVISALVILTQVWKSAGENPVEALRTE